MRRRRGDQRKKKKRRLVKRLECRGFRRTPKLLQLRTKAMISQRKTYSRNACLWQFSGACLRIDRKKAVGQPSRAAVTAPDSSVPTRRRDFILLYSRYSFCALQRLLSEFHASFSRNDGNLLEALHSGLLSAVADIVEAAPRSVCDRDEPVGVNGRVEAQPPPITWEEVRITPA